MRILYYSPHPHLNLGAPSGYATHMREMIRAFNELGHEVDTLIMGGEAYVPSSGEAQTGRKTWLKRLIPKPMWETMKDIALLRHDRQARQVLEQRVAAHRPDMIYERGYYLMRSGLQVARRAGVVHFLEMNAPYTEEREDLAGGKTWLQGWGRRFEGWQVRETRCVVTVSSALVDYFTKEYGATRFLITPNAIDPQHIRVDVQAAAHLRDQLGLGGGPVIGFAGSIFPWHGVDLLIRAFAAIGDQHPAARLLIVGGGGILPELRRLATELGVSHRVAFTGNVPHDQVFAHLELMDIAVMAKSNWYGSPIKIFEYGAMGKAVIAPDNIPVRDVMTHGEDGLLVAPQVADLTSALGQLLQDEPMRRRLAATFQKKVLMRHTWQQMAHAVLDVYWRA